jgi:hypothetical protein
VEIPVPTSTSNQEIPVPTSTSHQDIIVPTKPVENPKLESIIDQKASPEEDRNSNLSEKDSTPARKLPGFDDDQDSPSTRALRAWTGPGEPPITKRGRDPKNPHQRPLPQPQSREPKDYEHPHPTPTTPSRPEDPANFQRKFIKPREHKLPTFEDDGWRGVNLGTQEDLTDGNQKTKKVEEKLVPKKLDKNKFGVFGGAKVNVAMALAPKKPRIVRPSPFAVTKKDEPLTPLTPSKPKVVRDNPFGKIVKDAGFSFK